MEKGGYKLEKLKEKKTRDLTKVRRIKGEDN